MIEVYTDGACKGNPGPGGWAWVVPGGRWASGADRDTTNQRMELTAALEALRALEGRVEVVSDSTYVVNCFRDGWWKGWRARGWRNAKKEPVANRDLWEPLVDLVEARGDEVAFRWVKGHAGDEWNDIADRLAVEAAETQQGRSGAGTPEMLGPADGEPRSAEADSPPVVSSVDRPANSSWRPTGRAVVVTGLQPPELGGYEDNPIATRVRDRLADILAAKHELDPSLVVLTGLRLGAETLAAEAALERGVPYVAVLPFPEPDARWPRTARERFARLCAGAADVVQLERKSPADPRRAGAALDRRNGWLRTVADEAVVVWDRRERRVGEQVAALERDFPDDVWIVEP